MDSLTASDLLERLAPLLERLDAATSVQRPDLPVVREMARQAQLLVRSFAAVSRDEALQPPPPSPVAVAPTPVPEWFRVLTPEEWNARCDRREAEGFDHHRPLTDPAAPPP